jgi:hypothetical protein
MKAKKLWDNEKDAILMRLICLDVVSKITCVLAFELKAIPKSFIEHFLEVAHLFMLYIILFIFFFSV